MTCAALLLTTTHAAQYLDTMRNWYRVGCVEVAALGLVPLRNKGLDVLVQIQYASRHLRGVLTVWQIEVDVLGVAKHNLLLQLLCSYKSGQLKH
jgi:hypothetical protein